MNDNANTPQEWDEKLSSEQYLNEVGFITKVRIDTAKKLWTGQTDVVNIGSGQGFLETQFKEEVELDRVKWTSVDISQEGLNRIKKLFPKIECIKSDIRRLSLPSSSCAMVYCMEVLEHLTKADVQIAYKELLRIGKKNCIYVLSVPVFEPAPLKNHPVGHNRKYIPKIFIEEVNKNGFKVIKNIPIYAFDTGYSVKQLTSKSLHLRRPSVIMAICRKS